MEDYEGFHDNVNEQPETAAMNEADASPATTDETPVTAETSGPAEQQTYSAAPRQETENPYVHPQGFGGYADAGYIPAADAGAVPKS